MGEEGVGVGYGVKKRVVWVGKGGFGFFLGGC